MGGRTGRPRGWINDPEKRRARAMKAGAAAARAHRERAIAASIGLTPAAAYQKGDRVGYTRAWRYWRRWALRTVRQLTGRPLTFAELGAHDDEEAIG